MATTVIRQKILELVTARDPGKSICPSEVARSLDPNDWRRLLPTIREVAAQLIDRGLIVATQKGQLVDLASAVGPIRLSKHHDNRPSRTPTMDLINLGPVCCKDLADVDIDHLGDLRRHGAFLAFEAVMISKLHRGTKKNLFHAMYLIALWGALQNRNCMRLPASIREALRRRAANCKIDLLGR
ncbi:MAG: DUF3253 domain-containing protein [Planctomycetota bacterium]